MLRELYREFYYISKDEKITDRVFMSRMILSVLTMLMCSVALCATTLAWFTDQKTTSVAFLQAADYTVQVEINGTQLSSDEETDVETRKYTCVLAEKDEHTFTITACGTATVGYCTIDVNENSYTTESISQGKSITLTIVAAKDTKITFSASWGEPGSTDAVKDRDTIEVSRTSYVTYQIQEGVTLEHISAYYGVSEDDILLYNGISESSELLVGQEIYIPNSKVTEPLTIAADETDDVDIDTHSGEQEPTESNVDVEEPEGSVAETIILE